MVGWPLPGLLTVGVRKVGHVRVYPGLPASPIVCCSHMALRPRLTFFLIRRKGAFGLTLQPVDRRFRDIAFGSATTARERAHVAQSPGS